MGRLRSRLGAILVLAATLAPSQPPALVLIVHPSRSDSLTIAEASAIYLKKRRFWTDGEVIVPLNLPAETAAREQFSRRVLGRGSNEMSGYWNQQYFQGVFPPVTLSSGVAVKRYVASDRNAVGYVEAREVDGSVRVVLRLD
jgi:hypothetical protein